MLVLCHNATGHQCWFLTPERPGTDHLDHTYFLVQSSVQLVFGNDEASWGGR